MSKQSKRLLIILISIAFLLLIPLIAMQFTDEVKWTTFDFVIATILLLSAGLLIELVIRKVQKNKNRIIAVLVILFIILLIWVELAVGLIGASFGGS